VVSSGPEAGVVVKPTPGAVKSIRSMKATLVLTTLLSASLRIVALARSTPTNWGEKDDTPMVVAPADVADARPTMAQTAIVYLLVTFI
jgi:hypothetical protein